MDKTIALYMRLSDEDDNLAAHEESNSISHISGSSGKIYQCE